MTAPRAPFERMLPAWLAVSLIVHAAVFAGAALLPRSQGASPERTMRVVVAGTVTPPRPADDPSQQERPAPKVQAPRIAASAPPQSRERTARHRSRQTRRLRPRDPRPTEPTTPKQSATPASQRAPAGGDRLAHTSPGTSASAPRMGRPGAPADGPVAGGGAQPLTRATHGPSSFAVTAPEPAGGTGPGVGGSGSGLGAGGSASGVGGSGTPGGEGPGSGGQGGSGRGYIASRGAVGAGAGRGPGASPPSRSAPAPRSEPRPESQRQPDPAPDPEPESDPQPPPASESQPDPEPQSQRHPKPSQADLSRFRSMVQSRINSARRYPASARRQGWSGTARVSFSVTPSGSATGISLASSSGYQALDNEALRAVRRAAPYRPFPKGLSTPIRVTATVVFRLR